MPRKSLREVEPELVWDKKKLAIAAIILVAFIAAAVYVKRFVLSNSKGPTSTISVKGISTEASPNHSFSLPTQENVQEKIQQVKDQITHLSVQDIATSSPQIQQVLQQLQSLPSYPASQAKNVCIQLCNKL